MYLIITEILYIIKQRFIAFSIKAFKRCLNNLLVGDAALGVPLLKTNVTSNLRYAEGGVPYKKVIQATLE